MPLIKQFYADATRPSINKGSVIPPWYNDIDNESTWYLDGDYNFFYNVVGDDLYIQYGQNYPGWASARFLEQSLEITNEVENSDGSITADIAVQLHFFNGRKNSVGSVGWAVDYHVTINGITQYQFSGNTRDNFNNGQRSVINDTVTVQPEEELTDYTIKISITYPNGEAPDNIITVGFSIYNPNPPSYVPMAIRKSSNWRDLNSNNGKIFRRISNAWVDKSEENRNTSRGIDKGKNRIRISGNWRQLPPMNGGNTE